MEPLLLEDVQTLPRDRKAYHPDTTSSRTISRLPKQCYPFEPVRSKAAYHVFRVPFLFAIALIIAFGGGIYSTLLALNATAGFGAIRLGAWEAFPLAHTINADPYAKSHRARAGALLYGTAEALVFSASVDDTGEKLLGSCRYRLTGATPPARLWTLYAADPSNRPLPTMTGLPGAFNSWTVLRDSDSNMTIDIGATAHSGNWLAVPPTGNFKLVLTLLDTPTAGSSGIIDLTMPHIARIGCGDA